MRHFSDRPRGLEWPCYTALCLSRGAASHQATKCCARGGTRQPTNHAPSPKLSPIHMPRGPNLPFPPYCEFSQTCLFLTTPLCVLLMGSRYKTNVPLGWIANQPPSVNLALPSPKAKATVIPSESQPVQKEEEDTPSFAVKNNRGSNKLPFEQDDTSLLPHGRAQPRPRTRYTSAFPSNWTTTQDTSITREDDPQTSRDIDQSDEPRSSGEGEASADPQLNPPHQGPYAESRLGQLQEVSEVERASAVPSRQSGHPLATHSRDLAVQRRARSRRRDIARRPLPSPSESSAISTNSPASRGEASVGAPSVSPAYST